MKKLFILPCFLISLASLAQTKIDTFQGTQPQAYVESDEPGSTIPFANFKAAHADLHGDGVITTGRSFISFDLSSIPVGSKLNWAKLSLYEYSFEGFNSCKLRRITSPWDYQTVSWRTQPSTTKRGQVSLANSQYVHEQYTDLNVWNLVQPMIDSPSTSFGFALKLDTETGKTQRIMNIVASPTGTSKHFPRLILEYTPPGFQKQNVTSVSFDMSGASTKMNIYPNPCNGIFNCNIKSSAENINLRVIDILGRTVYSQPVNTSNLQLRVNLPSSSAGTYFVVLQDDKNATIVSQQIEVN